MERGGLERSHGERGGHDSRRWWRDMRPREEQEVAMQVRGVCPSLRLRTQEDEQLCREVERMPRDEDPDGGCFSVGPAAT